MLSGGACSSGDRETLGKYVRKGHEDGIVDAIVDHGQCQHDQH
jgi:hypothetical protein